MIKRLWPRLSAMRSTVAAREHQDRPNRRHRKLDAGTTAVLLLLQAILQFPSLLPTVHWLSTAGTLGRTGSGVSTYPV